MPEWGLIHFDGDRMRSHDGIVVLGGAGQGNLVRSLAQALDRKGGQALLSRLLMIPFLLVCKGTVHRSKVLPRRCLIMSSRIGGQTTFLC